MSVKSESPEGVGAKRRDLTDLSGEINFRARRGFQAIGDIKLLVEKKFVELEKSICTKMSYRQEILRFGENKSVIVYISLHIYNGILSKYILKNLKLKSIW